MRYVNAVVSFLILLGSAGASANQFCFAYAETYYEQVYCQLQARAQAANLPPLHQFKKNNEQVQYSLLKRPAERNAIKLAPPVKAVVTELLGDQPPASQPTTKQLPSEQALAQGIPSHAPSSEPVVLTLRSNSQIPRDLNRDAECLLRDREITCPEGNYALVGNRANHRLQAGALESHNQMGLPGITSLTQGLGAAYEKYIAKMCEIGLCGVTMTYRKFAFLYQDLQAKGLDFTQRFETMFGFLKKDKASMAVSEAINLPEGLKFTDCGELGVHYYVCDYQGRNFVFTRR